VQGAYRTIREQDETNDGITQKLERLVKTQRVLIEKTALTQVGKTDDELLQTFVGDWQLDDGSVLKLWIENSKLTSSITTQSKDYESVTYKIVTRYQPGLLELDATLDELNLKLRAEPEVAPAGIGGGLLGGFGSMVGNALSLLGSMTTRPSSRMMLLFDVLGFCIPTRYKGHQFRVG
jgi:hypothetical protein